MKVSDFNFDLPENLIATSPISPRDHSRMLVLDKENGEISHKRFYDILDYFEKGDLLVLNNSKVFPARLLGKVKESERKIEVFLLHPQTKYRWQCLIGGKKIKEGLTIKITDYFEVLVREENGDGTWLVELPMEGKGLMGFLEMNAKIPLPPYIEKQRKLDNKKYNTEKDKKDYQTVFAEADKQGSVAAPTAGLHFTPELLEKIKNKGVNIEYITLHVGMGTFAPVKVDDIESHKMHAEWVEISSKTVKKIRETQNNKNKIIAVGTTSARSLEALGNSDALSAWVDIFIYPGYQFKNVDSIVTNFHLPKSTLIMLVSAMAGKEEVKRAYKEAIEKKYRFYSYGDAMFIK
ncbi:tRNA preQ1(34) S-adenosylmethionine ribosyltransferase-isomerase QueA [Candidatus Parcubacteria bacterium]|nr:MAG: tRNA preQ1(34) S-adenosylmethionine ribosyltransferase-isomerase QueA [Candidatus Parcubacteria bacterium]